MISKLVHEGLLGRKCLLGQHNERPFDRSKNYHSCRTDHQEGKDGHEKRRLVNLFINCHEERNNEVVREINGIACITEGEQQGDLTLYPPVSSINMARRMQALGIPKTANVLVFGATALGYDGTKLTSARASPINIAAAGRTSFVAQIRLNVRRKCPMSMPNTKSNMMGRLYT